MTQTTKNGSSSIAYAIVRKSDNNYFCSSHGWSSNINNAFLFMTEDAAFEAMADMSLSSAQFCLQLHLIGDHKIEGPLE